MRKQRSKVGIWLGTFEEAGWSCVETASERVSQTYL
jgi:hypothetical protein